MYVLTTTCISILILMHSDAGACHTSLHASGKHCSLGRSIHPGLQASTYAINKQPLHLASSFCS